MYKFILDDKENPEYSSLIYNSNNLMVKMDEIHREINKVQAPLYWPWSAKSHIRKIARKLKILTDDFLKWQDKAWSFYQNPVVNIKRTENVSTDMAYIHFTNFFINRIHQITNKFNAVWRDVYQMI